MPSQRDYHQSTTNKPKNNMTTVPINDDAKALLDDLYNQWEQSLSDKERSKWQAKEDAAENDNKKYEKVQEDKDKAFVKSLKTTTKNGNKYFDAQLNTYNGQCGLYDSKLEDLEKGKGDYSKYDSYENIKALYSNAEAMQDADGMARYQEQLDNYERIKSELETNRASSQATVDNYNNLKQCAGNIDDFLDAYAKGDTEAMNNLAQSCRESINNDYFKVLVPNESNLETETAEVNEIDIQAQAPVAEQSVIPESAPEKLNPYAFDIQQPSGMTSTAFDNGTDNCYRAQEQRRLERELNEQKAAEVMKADGSIDAAKLSELGSQGYDTASIYSIAEQKNKEKEGVSTEAQTAETVETQTVETAEVPENDAKGAAPTEEKPNPYAFEKPAREADEKDDEYEKRCALAEAEHIDSVNRQAAADINAGKYGNGEDRKKALAEAGLDYDAVQSIINNEYVPLYEAEKAKQAEAAKQAATPSDAEIEAALAESNNKIEVKDINNVKTELDVIEANVQETLKFESPEAQAQAVAHAIDHKFREGQPVSEELLNSGYSEPMPDDMSIGFEPIGDESEAEDETTSNNNNSQSNPARASLDAQIGPQGQPAADAFTAGGSNDNRGNSTEKPVSENMQNGSIEQMDTDYSSKSKDDEPGVIRDENGEVIEIRGDELDDEPASTQNDMTNDKTNKKGTVTNFRIDEINAPVDISDDKDVQLSN